MNHHFRRLSPVIAAACLILAGGCSTKHWAESDPDLRGPVAVSEHPLNDEVRILPVFTGRGEPMGWDDLLDACDWAEVIVIGEQHNDGVGHGVQRAVVRDVMRQHPEGSALALEMLERDEQVLVDDYLDDIITASQLAKLSHSEHWAGHGSWAEWYQPIIDEAKQAGRPVIAANAPRRYVRYARTAGYDALNDLPAQRRRLFNLPTSLRTGSYRERFFELMRDMGDHDPETEQDEPPTDAEIAAMFRSQMVWDATMSESVIRALREDQEKVVLLVGQFHSDYNGGTMQELRRRSPTSRVMNISMVPRGATEFNEEDEGRADIVIYTPVVEEEQAEQPEEDADEFEEHVPPHPEEEYDAPKPVTPPHGKPDAPTPAPTTQPHAPEPPPAPTPTTQPDNRAENAVRDSARGQ